MTTTKFIKRIQSRLSDRGIRPNDRAIPLGVIREFYAELPLDDQANPSDEQLNQVCDRLIDYYQASNSQIGTLTKNTAASQLAQSIEEENEAIGPKDEEDNRGTGRITNMEQGQGQDATSYALPPNKEENSSTQNPLSSGIVPREPSQSGLVPQSEVAGMVERTFSDHPELQQQITDYAMERTFSNVSQVQEFLEHLRGVEFNLLVKSLDDHVNRRGSMLTLFNQLLTEQGSKEEARQTSFFSQARSQLGHFEQEMMARLSKTGL